MARDSYRSWIKRIVRLIFISVFMKTYDEERAEMRKWCMDIAAAACESDDAEDLLFHLLMKRQCDGLNGRCWDASEHLKHEQSAVQILNGLTNGISDSA